MHHALEQGAIPQGSQKKPILKLLSMFGGSSSKMKLVLQQHWERCWIIFWSAGDPSLVCWLVALEGIGLLNTVPQLLFGTGEGSKGLMKNSGMRIKNDLMLNWILLEVLSLMQVCGVGNWNQWPWSAYHTICLEENLLFRSVLEYGKLST